MSWSSRSATLPQPLTAAQIAAAAGVVTPPPVANSPTAFSPPSKAVWHPSVLPHTLQRIPSSGAGSSRKHVIISDEEDLEGAHGPTLQHSNSNAQTPAAATAQLDSAVALQRTPSRGSVSGGGAGANSQHTDNKHLAGGGAGGAGGGAGRSPQQLASGSHAAERGSLRISVSSSSARGSSGVPPVPLSLRTVPEALSSYTPLIPLTPHTVHTTVFSAEQIRDLRLAFNAIDTNGDGMLSSAEIKAVFPPAALAAGAGSDNSAHHQPAGGSNERWERIMSCAGSGATRAGIIDFDQFLILIAEQMRHTAIESQLKETFARYDTNRNGRIELDELRQLLTTVQAANRKAGSGNAAPAASGRDGVALPAVSDAVVSTLLRSIDTNRNGTIEFNELAQMIMRAGHSPSNQPSTNDTNGSNTSPANAQTSSNPTPTNDAGAAPTPTAENTPPAPTSAAATAALERKVSASPKSGGSSGGGPTLTRMGSSGGTRPALTVITTPPTETSAAATAAAAAAAAAAAVPTPTASAGGANSLGSPPGSGSNSLSGTPNLSTRKSLSSLLHDRQRNPPSPSSNTVSLSSGNLLPLSSGSGAANKRLSLSAGGGMKPFGSAGSNSALLTPPQLTTTISHTIPTPAPSPAAAPAVVERPAIPAVAIVTTSPSASSAGAAAAGALFGSAPVDQSPRTGTGAGTGGFASPRLASAMVASDVLPMHSTSLSRDMSASYVDGPTLVAAAELEKNDSYSGGGSGGSAGAGAAAASSGGGGPPPLTKADSGSLSVGAVRRSTAPATMITASGGSQYAVMTPAMAALAKRLSLNTHQTGGGYMSKEAARHAKRTSVYDTGDAFDL